MTVVGFEVTSEVVDRDKGLVALGAVLVLVLTADDLVVDDLELDGHSSGGEVGLERESERERGGGREGGKEL